MKMLSKQTFAKLVVGFLGILLIGWLLYQDGSVRATVVGFVGKLGKPAVPYLRSALNDENSHVRGKADHALRLIGEDAVPSLTESLNSTNPQERFEAARAMVIVGKNAKSALPTLIQTFKSDPDNKTRALVVRVFGHLGAEAEDAIPVLLPALKDSDAAIRANAAEALSIIALHGDVERIVAALIDSLKDDVANVRQEAAEGLGRIGPRAGAAVDALTKALQDPNARVKREAAEALEQVRGKKE